ncbi:MAG TPA: MYG1 family protein [Candidatus Paceibacterota bacterium]|jgi:Uncharacterized conserved protein related to MYG1 family
MAFFSRRKTIVAHSGRFHADDLFAVAMLMELLDGKGKVIRTNDDKDISKGDYVVDIGRVYDPIHNRFDHHQGDAGARANGVPYAASGLVWKHYGERIAGGAEAARMIDESLVQPIDIHDTGFVGPKPIIEGVYSYQLDDIARAFDSTWIEREEGRNTTKAFLDLLPFARKLLRREIARAQAQIKAKEFVLAAYDAASDKRIIVSDRYLPLSALDEKKDVLFVVGPSSRDGQWAVSTMRINKHEFKNRKDLPAAWAGKSGAEMATVSGVPDAVFCHLGRFLAIAKSKEGAVALAKKAIEA